MKRLLLLLPVCCALMTGGASARTWVVLPDSTGDAPTIQAGIDSASAGDTVMVMCGTYYEHDITLKSGINLTSETGISDCVTIDATGLGRVFYCDSADSTTSVVGLTAANGNVSGNGGGMFCDNSNLRIVECTFRDSRAGGSGGGIYLRDCDPRLTICTISNNYAGAAGNGNGGGVAMYRCSPVFTDCIFSGNEVPPESLNVAGGGVHFGSGSPTFTGCVFSDNKALMGNGAGLCAGGSYSVNLVECLFERNDGMWGGGALLGGIGSGCIVSNCTFRDNSSSAGGGLYCYKAAAIVTGCTFEMNTANTGGGLDSGRDSSLVVTDCVFLENTATSEGGGFYGRESSVLTRCSFLDNTAANRGGGASSRGSPTFSECVFAGNHVDGAEIWQGGGGVSVWDKSSAELINCTLYANGCNGPGGGVFCGSQSSASLDNCIIAFGDEGKAVHTDATSTPPVLTCCDLYGNEGGDWTDGIAGQYGINGNFSADPWFCDPVNYDISLDSASVCVDAPGCGLVGALGAGCSFTAGVEDVGKTTGFLLHQNMPNPFSSSTVIRFVAPEGTVAILTVHDVTGREIVSLSGRRTAGELAATWDGKDASGEEVGPGIYFVQMEARGFRAVRKMIVLR